MTSRTRYFVITSLLVLAIGLGTGLVAYYVGLPGGLAGSDGPDELQYVPRDATVVAYAQVREIMISDVRQRIPRVVPPGAENGQRQFQDLTGIDIESDIDHVVASLQPGPDGKMAGLVVARGRFSDVKIEALMREHGAEVKEYNGQRVIAHRPGGGDSIALSFLEPGLVALGSGQMVRRAIDLQKSGESVTKNAELMDLMRSLGPGNAWAIGRLDALLSDGRLPAQFTTQLPAITWFSVSGRVDSDIRAIVRADTRDDEAANNLRDVVQGFLALAKLQAGTRPELQMMMQSLELGGTGKSVSLSFLIPGAVFDTLGATAPATQQPLSQ
jgi:hypothetical protein